MGPEVGGDEDAGLLVNGREDGLLVDGRESGELLVCEEDVLCDGGVAAAGELLGAVLEV